MAVRGEGGVEDGEEEVMAMKIQCEESLFCTLTVSRWMSWFGNCTTILQAVTIGGNW